MASFVVVTVRRRVPNHDDVVFVNGRQRSGHPRAARTKSLLVVAAPSDGAVYGLNKDDHRGGTL